MNSFSVQVLSALAAGCMAAVGWHLVPHHTPHSLRPAATASAIAAAKQQERAAARRHAQQAAAEVAAPYLPGNVTEGARQPGGKTLLLGEPVVMRNQTEAGWTPLPRGTSVKLLASEGRFLRVGYADNIVTVPRSVVVSGLSRTN